MLRRPVQFTSADLRLFAAASHDRSPLHRDCEETRRGQFGGPIVFGCLGLLGAAAALPPVAGTPLCGLSAAFLQPMYVDTRYVAQIERQEGSRVTVTMVDGVTPVLRATFSRAAREPYIRPRLSEVAPRLEPRRREPGDFSYGDSACGSYGVAARFAASLLRRFGLPARGFSEYALQAVLFASYLVGMEIPGEGGIFSSLRISLSEGESAAVEGCLTFKGSVVELDRRLGSMTVAATLSHGREAVAQLTCGAELRARPRPLDLEQLSRLLPGGRTLEGKAGVVVGAEGAIGRAVAEALAMEGCSVFGLARQARRGPEDSDGIRMVAGDCGSATACRRLREDCDAEGNGIDLLVCAAAPPMRSLSLHEDSNERYLEFVAESLSLVATPMAAFLPALSRRAGCCLLLSSAALLTMPLGWGHYLSSKAAAEVTFAAASRSWTEIEFVTARLPLVRTPRLGSLAKEQDSVSVERVSAWLVRRLTSPAGAGLHLLDWPAVKELDTRVAAGTSR